MLLILCWCIFSLNFYEETRMYGRGWKVREGVERARERVWEEYTTIFFYFCCPKEQTPTHTHIGTWNRHTKYIYTLLCRRKCKYFIFIQLLKVLGHHHKWSAKLLSDPLYAVHDICNERSKCMVMISVILSRSLRSAHTDHKTATTMTTTN